MTLRPHALNHLAAQIAKRREKWKRELLLVSDLKP